MAQEGSERDSDLPPWVATVLADLERSAKLPDIARGDWREIAMRSLSIWMWQVGADAATILTAAQIENQNRCRPALNDEALEGIVHDVVAGQSKPPRVEGK